MGNELCTKAVNCDRLFNDAGLHQEAEPTPRPVQEPMPPRLNDNIQQILQSKSSTIQNWTKLKSDVRRVRFGEEIYQGCINVIGQPHGLGKMYKQDGSLFVGMFNHGSANGQGLLIFPDGSYFEGWIKNNIAQCENGTYQCSTYTYNGQFRDNIFHGMGQEIGQTYIFQGSYLNGLRQMGQLKWWNQPGQDHMYKYYGKFDQNGLFTDEGIVQQPTGKYTGSFLHGKKHGEGVYKYKNNIQYEGSYKNGMKQGFGKIMCISNEETIYEGEWKNNLPEGEGTRFDQKGNKEKTYYIDGINVFSLKDQSNKVA